MARVHQLPICFDGGQWKSVTSLDTGPGSITAMPLNTGSASGVQITSPDGDSLGGLRIAYVGLDYPLAAYGNDMSQRYRSFAWKGLPSTVLQTDTSNPVNLDFIKLAASSNGTFLRTSIPVAVAATGFTAHSSTTFTHASGFGTDAKWVGSVCNVNSGDHSLTITSHTDTVLTGTWDTEPDNTTDPWVLNNTNSFQLTILDGATPTDISGISDFFYKSDMAVSDIWELQVDTETGGADARVRLIRNGTEVVFANGTGWIQSATITDPLSAKSMGGTVIGKSPSSGITWDFDWIDVYDEAAVPDLSALSAFAVTARYVTADVSAGDYIAYGNAAGSCSAQLWRTIDDPADDDNQADDYVSVASFTGVSNVTTSTTLTDSSESWTTDEWVDFYVVTDDGKWMKITSNTGAVLTGASWTPSDPGSGGSYAILASNLISACDFTVAGSLVASETTPTIEGVAIEAIAERLDGAASALTVTTPATDFAARIVTDGGTNKVQLYKDTFSSSDSPASYYGPTADSPGSLAWTAGIFDDADTTFGIQGKLLEGTKVWGLIVHIAGENLVKQANASACPATGSFIPRVLIY